MRFTYALIFFVFLFCMSCSNDPEPVESNDSIPQLPLSPEYDSLPFKKNWVIMHYIDCMAGSCACECDSIVSNKFIRIDSLNGQLCAQVYTFSGDTEVWQLRLAKDGKLESSHKNDTRHWKFMINGSRLMLNDNVHRMEPFFNYPEYEQYDATQFFMHYNVRAFADNLNSTDTLIQSLLALDSTTLTCDSVLGNLIYAPELPEHKWWIVKMLGDSVVLYQYRGDRDKMHKGDTIRVGAFPRY